MKCTRDEIEVFLGPQEINRDVSTAGSSAQDQDQEEKEKEKETIQPKQDQSADPDIQIKGKEEGEIQENQLLLLPQIPETAPQPKELNVSASEDLLECSLCGSGSFQNLMEHCKTCGLIVHNYCMPRSILFYPP